MTRKEQVLDNRKSLARLHVLECNQWIMHKINSVEKKEKMTRKEQILANRKSLARLHVLEFHQLIMHKINSVEKKEENDQEGADPGHPEVLGSLAHVRMSSADHR